MKHELRWFDYITINIYYLGLTTVAQTLGLVFPLLVQQFVGEAAKGSFLGALRLWTLMAALLMQAVWGMLSDRSMFPTGRRRPFILLGTLGNLIFIAAIGFTAGLNGMAGFWLLFIFALGSQIVSNAGQAAQQGLIPDLVPERQRGRFSGIKAVMELPLPLILVSFTIARFISRGDMRAGVILAMGVLIASMILTMFVPEHRQEKVPPPFDWKPVLRLALMAAVFTAIILSVGAGVRLLGRLLASVQAVPVQVVVMGGAGLIAMLIAVALGVWLSVRISIGKEGVRQHPSFTWWVINRLAFLVGAINLSTFAVYFVQARLGFTRETAAGPASLMMMVVGVFILLSALPSGWLADRVGRKPLVAVSGFLAALGTLIALLSLSMTMIYIGACLIGAATGLFFAANWALGADIVPREEAGRYLGISNLAGAGAGAVGAYIGGPIADYFTAHVPGIPGLGYVLLFTIYGMLFLFSVAALAKVKESQVEHGLQTTFASQARPAGSR